MVDVDIHWDEDEDEDEENARVSCVEEAAAFARTSKRTWRDPIADAVDFVAVWIFELADAIRGRR